MIGNRITKKLLSNRSSAYPYNSFQCVKASKTVDALCSNELKMTIIPRLRQVAF